MKKETLVLNMYANRLKAAGEINKYIEDLFLAELLGLRGGSFVSSHSFCKTGAVAAARTLCDFLMAIMPWGYWKSITSAMPYVRSCTLAWELFDWMPRLQRADPVTGGLDTREAKPPTREPWPRTKR